MEEECDNGMSGAAAQDRMEVKVEVKVVGWRAERKKNEQRRGK